MLAKLLKAVLEWLTGLVKSEMKKDVKATDANTPDEIVDDFRDSMRRKLRKHKSNIHPDGE